MQGVLETRDYAGSLLHGLLHDGSPDAHPAAQLRHCKSELKQAKKT
jgi:hypothetical protein